MQKDHRLAGGIAALLEVNLVDRRDLKPARAVGLYRRVQPGDGIFHGESGWVGCGHGGQYNPVVFAERSGSHQSGFEE